MLTTSPLLGVFLLGVNGAIDSPDPLGVVCEKDGNSRGLGHRKWSFYFAASYAVDQLVQCTENKLDNKVGFITQGGSNQEFTLGLEDFLKLAFIFVVIKLKSMTDFLI